MVLKIYNLKAFNNGFLYNISKLPIAASYDLKRMKCLALQVTMTTL